MKYLAICLLSLASLIATAGASQSSAIAAVVPAPLAALAPESVFGDRALAGALAAALVALQLRRRQKSLLMPRPLN